MARPWETMRWPDAPPRVLGERVVLRPRRPDDADAVFDACQDPAIQRWTTVPVPYLREHAMGFVRDYAEQQWSARRGAPLCVASPDEDRVLGSCDLVKIDDVNLVAEIGDWIAPWSRGRGVATEAVQLLTAWAIDEVGFARIELLIDPENSASCAVAEGVGCMLEGVLRSKALVRGRRRDLAVYALVR